MDYEPMDVLEVLDRLHRQLLLEGWTFDGATTYVDALMHVQGQVEREEDVLWALKEHDCLSLAVPAPVYHHYAGVAVLA